MRLKDIKKDMEVTVQGHPDYAGATGMVTGFKDDKVIVVLVDGPFKDASCWFYPRELYLKE